MLTAADVMTKDVVTIAPDQPVREIARLLQQHRISGVPVIDEHRHVIGIVSEADLIGHSDVVGEQHRSWWLSLLSDEGMSARDYVRTHGRRARDIMASDVATVGEDASVAAIARILKQFDIKRVPVVRGGILVGIVSRGDLLRALADSGSAPPVAVDDDSIRDRLIAVLKTQPWAHLPSKNIEVVDGKVSLSGIVQSEDERHALRVAAENIPGVTGIDDHLSQWTPIAV